MKTNALSDTNRKKAIAQEKARLIQLLVEALKHHIYRNHPYSETCSACLQGTLVLKKHGYLP